MCTPQVGESAPLGSRVALLSVTCKVGQSRPANTSDTLTLSLLQINVQMHMFQSSRSVSVLCVSAGRSTAGVRTLGVTWFMGHLPPSV